MKKYDTFRLPLILAKDNETWKLKCKADGLKYAVDFIVQYAISNKDGDFNFPIFYKDYIKMCRTHYVDTCSRAELKTLFNMLSVSSTT